MKKLLIPLIAAFAANTVSAAAPQQVIDISTDKVSMVLTAAPLRLPARRLYVLIGSRRNYGVISVYFV